MTQKIADVETGALKAAQELLKTPCDEAFVRATGGYSRRDPQYSGAQRGRPLCRHRRRRCVNLKAITPPKIDDSAGFSAKLVRKRISWRQEVGVENGDRWSWALCWVEMEAMRDM